MGLLTLLDSRTHRNANLWKELLEFTVEVIRNVSLGSLIINTYLAKQVEILRVARTLVEVETASVWNVQVEPQLDRNVGM